MKTIADLLKNHVTLDVECIDRMYLNGYIAKLQTPQGLNYFLSNHRGNPVASPALLNRMTKDFVKGVEQFAQDNDIPIVQFEKRQRKDDVANNLRAERGVRDGVVFIGVAQEKAQAFKGRKIGPYDFDFSRQSVFIKHYYFYIDDADFGPGFIKICTYAPYPMRICLNGHEWVKRQLSQHGIHFQSLDNGFLSCDEPVALQAQCDQLAADHIEGFLQKWIRLLPFPLTELDRSAGYRHELSIWQLEVSKTQVFSQPLRGREFFENVIRENIDLGRPDRVQLLFDRKIRKTTPGRFATRVITSGVHPSIHIQYKHCHIKQYFKENRALRTETTIQNAADFGIGKRLVNLPYLQQLSTNINHRLLEVERASEDCMITGDSVERLTQVTETDSGQRSPALKLGDPRVMALYASLTLFLHSVDGFCNKQLRAHVADLLGVEEQQYTPRQMTYDLRRLRLKGIVYRRGGSTKYFLTTYGIKVAMYLTRLHAHILRPGLHVMDPKAEFSFPHRLAQAFNKVNLEVDKIFNREHLPGAA